MSNVQIKMQRVVVSLVLGSALILLAGCGGSNPSAGSESGGSNAPAAATPRVLPTMPQARFAAPTTMITPQADQTIEATATESITVSEEVTSTEGITATEEMTETEEMTDTE